MNGDSRGRVRVVIGYPKRRRGTRASRRGRAVVDLETGRARYGVEDRGGDGVVIEIPVRDDVGSGWLHEWALGGKRVQRTARRRLELMDDQAVGIHVAIGPIQRVQNC